MIQTISKLIEIEHTSSVVDLPPDFSAIAPNSAAGMEERVSW